MTYIERTRLRKEWRRLRKIPGLASITWKRFLDLSITEEEKTKMNGYEAACEKINAWDITMAMNGIKQAIPSMNSLDCCSTAIPVHPQQRLDALKEEALCKKNKENNMYLNTNMTPTAVEVQQRQYLLEREAEVSNDKDIELQKKFYINDEDPPKTPKELRERLSTGRFTIDGEDVNKFNPYQTAKGAIYWRDPAKPADMAGYGAATDAISAERQKVRDDIRIAPIADALASLRAFESTTVN